MAQENPHNLCDQSELPKHYIFQSPATHPSFNGLSILSGRRRAFVAGFVRSRKKREEPGSHEPSYENEQEVRILTNPATMRSLFEEIVVKNLGRMAAIVVFMSVFASRIDADERTPRRRASHPTYLLLRTPRTPAKSHAEYGYTPGRPRHVVGRGYTYGWFGVKPRRHWSRHFGYFRSYTEWKAR